MFFFNYRGLTKIPLTVSKHDLNSNSIDSEIGSFAPLKGHFISNKATGTPFSCICINGVNS